MSNQDNFVSVVAEYDLPEIYVKVAKFLMDENMNSDPAKWKSGYNRFIKYSGETITFKEFDEILNNMFNYYFFISFGYDYKNNTYGDFILRY